MRGRPPVDPAPVCAPWRLTVHLVLDIAPSASGVPFGTVRRSCDPGGDAITFHGVFELVDVLDRLLGDAGTIGSPEASPS